MILSGLSGLSRRRLAIFGLAMASVLFVACAVMGVVTTTGSRRSAMRSSAERARHWRARE